ncbi:methylaspartate ammonia-lyase [Micromonospora cremea]|uniref:methylaspartate ammonia-lyase n=1 Tax=Micromonospora cremea TaxID=709881 RepID=A0A1N5TEW3_9ACTN|nr:methylaspartate ammonia-lyase [Micromonospora cremea]SIM46668.1 methylaspartate ammonia-lyase [Micromonospora cremea]
MTDPVIQDVVAVPVAGGYFFDDQAAIRAGATRDGGRYLGSPVTPGFAQVREPAEAVSIILRLSDGKVVVGDCATVQYSGVAGREPRLRAKELAEAIEARVAPRLRGLPVGRYRSADEQARAICAEVLENPLAAGYGLSQALLAAAAHAAGHGMMAWTVQEEWGIETPLRRLPLYAQSGEARRSNVDTMIMKSVGVLPHGLINAPELVGSDGSALAAYVAWVAERIDAIGAADYAPELHFDVYGLVGAAAGGDIDRTVDILLRLERAAGRHPIRIEHPIDAGSREGQIAAFAKIRSGLAERGSRLRIVADEWANTVEDIAAFCAAGAADLIQVKTPDLGSLTNTIEAALHCTAHGVGVVLGGTCTETDVSARATTHVGLAIGATQLLAKPGMGVDEPLMIVGNEMARCLRLDALGRPGGRRG